MAEPFKNLINAQTVVVAADHIRRSWPEFAHERYVELACSGLDQLEMKARAMQICDALEHTLPSDFAEAADVLERALAPPIGVDEKGEPVGLGGAQTAGLAGWIIWPIGEFVARRGLSDIGRALECLHALTQRFSAEFAIRFLIAEQPAQVFKTLARWASDPSPHVRRLASEGSRPRLPWGIRLQALVADPSPCWPLLQALQDDPSAYVRRSVANHLNDIAKDHPDAVAAWVETQLRDAPPARVALLRHACRSLIKQGHPATLRAWGLSLGLVGQASLSVSPSTAHIGQAISLQISLTSSSSSTQSLVIDYAVHHQRANGSTSAKVFKGWKRDLGVGEHCTLQKTHSLKPVTTRRLYTGTHQVDLLINGEVAASSAFELLP